jgi:hypothetical protein
LAIQFLLIFQKVKFDGTITVAQVQNNGNILIPTLRREASLGLRREKTILLDILQNYPFQHSSSDSVYVFKF